MCVFVFRGRQKTIRCARARARSAVATVRPLPRSLRRGTPALPSSRKSRGPPSVRREVSGFARCPASRCGPASAGTSIRRTGVGVTATMYNRLMFFPGSMRTRKTISVSRGRAAAALIRSGQDVQFFCSGTNGRQTYPEACRRYSASTDFAAAGAPRVVRLFGNPRRRDPHLRVIAWLHRLPRA